MITVRNLESNQSLSNAQLVSLRQNEFKFKLEFYQRSSNVRKKRDLTSLLIDDDPTGRHDTGWNREKTVGDSSAMQYGM